MEYYPRKIEEKLEKWLKRREIVAIRGPRQSGKTTLLLHLKEKYGGNYVTLEDSEMLDTFSNAPREFAERFISDTVTNIYIDEAQYCASAGKILKLIHDLYSDKLKLFVTGSGSFDIKVEIGRYLVGRVAYFELMPLSFDEFLIWKERSLSRIHQSYIQSFLSFVLGDASKVEPSPAFQREFSSLLEEYLVFGGFPAIVKESDKEIKQELLKNLVTTYLEKDIFTFLGVRELEKFRDAVRYLSHLTGSLLSYSSLMSEMHMDYRTVEKYISLLAGTYIIYLVNSFHSKMVTELRKSRKVYFTDTGLRNSLISNFLPLASRPDASALYENFVHNELVSLGFRPMYWRTAGKAEVDFVILNDGNPIPIEVKSSGKVGRSFLSFMERYRPKRAVVLTNAQKKEVEVKGTTIVFLPYFFV